MKEGVVGVEEGANVFAAGLNENAGACALSLGLGFCSGSSLALASLWFGS